MLGTAWTASGEGATVAELYIADDPDCIVGGDLFEANRRTNLRLTGQPIQDYDRRRMEAAIKEK